MTRDPLRRLAIKLAATVLVVGVVVVFNCSDQALFASLAAVLIMGGEATANDLLPWLRDKE